MLNRYNQGLRCCELCRCECVNAMCVCMCVSCVCVFACVVPSVCVHVCVSQWVPWWFIWLSLGIITLEVTWMHWLCLIKFS